MKKNKWFNVVSFWDHNWIQYGAEVVSFWFIVGFNMVSK